MNIKDDDNDIKHSDGKESHKQIECPTTINTAMTFDTFIIKCIHIYTAGPYPS